MAKSAAFLFAFIGACGIYLQLIPVSATFDDFAKDCLLQFTNDKYKHIKKATLNLNIFLGIAKSDSVDASIHDEKVRAAYVALILVMAEASRYNDVDEKTKKFFAELEFYLKNGEFGALFGDPKHQRALDEYLAARGAKPFPDPNAAIRAAGSWWIVLVVSSVLAFTVIH